MENLHTFVVCAYKESAFLDECVSSLKAQNVKSTILIATSTPNDEITKVAEKHGVTVSINHGEAGITGDWGYALSIAETPFVTIAHQDDVYSPEYAEEILKRTKKSKRPIISFCDYYEIKNGERIDKSGVMKIKKLLNIPIRLFPRSKFMRRRALSLGNSICCPAVTYSKWAIENFSFDPAFRFACDWDAWERLGRNKGSFVYVPRPLMGHRIHEDSETTRIMADNRRTSEEYTMFRRFWPDFIAKRLSGAYAKGAENNKI